MGDIRDRASWSNLFCFHALSAHVDDFVKQIRIDYCSCGFQAYLYIMTEHKVSVMKSWFHYSAQGSISKSGGRVSRGNYFELLPLNLEAFFVC